MHNTLRRGLDRAGPCRVIEAGSTTNGFDGAIIGIMQMWDGKW